MIKTYLVANPDNIKKDIKDTSFTYYVSIFCYPCVVRHFINVLPCSLYHTIGNVKTLTQQYDIHTRDGDDCLWCYSKVYDKVESKQQLTLF